MWLSLLWPIACLAAAWLFYVVIVRPLLERRYYTQQGIRGPAWRPLIGNLSEVVVERGLADGFYGMFERASARYGRVSLFWMGPQLRLRCVHAGVARALLAGGGAADAALRKPALIRDTLGRLLGDGLVTSEGALHRAHRAMIAPAFAWARLRRMGVLMARAAAAAAERWRALPGAGAGAGAGALVDMHREMSAVTLDVIGQAAFGMEVDEAGAGAGDALYLTVEGLLRGLLEMVLSGMALFPILFHLPLPAVRTMDRRIREVKALLMAMIARRRAARAAAAAAAATSGEGARAVEDGGLLIDALLDAMGEDEAGAGGAARRPGAAGAAASPASAPAAPQRFSDGEVLDHAITFLLAGHETTSQGMCWTMLLLDSAEGRPWRAAARAQVLAVCGRERLPAQEDLEALPLLSQIISESMRLYPPVPFIARTAVADMALPYEPAPGGVLRIAAGTAFVIPISALHRDEEHWTDPHAFLPARWEHGRSAATRSGHAHAYLPFAAGTRNCIGANFALMELQLILARLLQTVEWAVDASYVHLPQMSVTLRPAHGMPMRVWALPEAGAPPVELPPPAVFPM